MYRKLCFCGFREDLATKAQEDREKGADMWPGGWVEGGREMNRRGSQLGGSQGRGMGEGQPRWV
jgi:hypothetical protein